MWPRGCSVYKSGIAEAARECTHREMRKSERLKMPSDSGHAEPKTLENLELMEALRGCLHVEQVQVDIID